MPHCCSSGSLIDGRYCFSGAQSIGVEFSIMDLTGLGTGVGNLQDQGIEFPFYASSTNVQPPFIHDLLMDGVQPPDIYDLLTDGAPLHGDGVTENNNENDYSSEFSDSWSTHDWHDEFIDLPNLLVCDPPLEQRQQQCSSFESPPNSSKALELNEGLLGVSTTFQERQAALVTQIIDRGTHKDFEAVKADQQDVHAVQLPHHETAARSKRARTTCCYTIEDVLKNLPRGSALARLGNESSQRNISVVATELPSDKKQQRFSQVPQSVAARRRRNQVRDKICELRKLLPLQSRLDDGTMLEVAGQYLKFLQAQVNVLECMPDDHPSADGTTSLSAASVAFGKNGVMGSPRNVHSLTNQTSSQDLSLQQMLQIMVTSRAIQRKLFSGGKCVTSLQQYQMLASARDSNNFWPSSGKVTNNLYLLDFPFH